MFQFKYIDQLSCIILIINPSYITVIHNSIKSFFTLAAPSTSAAAHSMSVTVPAPIEEAIIHTNNTPTPGMYNNNKFHYVNKAINLTP
jgi:hypothetical protein